MGRTIGLQEARAKVSKRAASETAACIPSALSLIAVGRATVPKLSSTHLRLMHARCTNIESDKTTSIHEVRRTEVVSSLGIFLV